MGPFKNRHGHCNNSDNGHGHFLKSTGDIGDSPSRAAKVVNFHLVPQNCPMFKRRKNYKINRQIKIFEVYYKSC